MPLIEEPYGAWVHEDWINRDDEHELFKLLEREYESGKNTQQIGKRSVLQWSPSSLRYDFKTRHWCPPEPQADPAPWPRPVQAMVSRLIVRYGVEPEHVIANRYGPCETIKPHVDSSCFGNIVFSLSLGSLATLTFSCKGVQRRVQLPRRSLLMMMGAARWNWQHSVYVPPYLPGVSSRYGGVRWSLTFRQVNRG